MRIIVNIIREFCRLTAAIFLNENFGELERIKTNYLKKNSF